MKRFIEENINVIPENYVKKFEQLSIERKVSKIKHYLEMQKWREEGIERNSVLFRVKDIFEKRKANKEDAASDAYDERPRNTNRPNRE